MSIDRAWKWRLLILGASGFAICLLGFVLLLASMEADDMRVLWSIPAFGLMMCVGPAICLGGVVLFILRPVKAADLRQELPEDSATWHFSRRGLAAVLGTFVGGPLLMFAIFLASWASGEQIDPDLILAIGAIVVFAWQGFFIWRLMSPANHSWLYVVRHAPDQAKPIGGETQSFEFRISSRHPIA